MLTMPTTSPGGFPVSPAGIQIRIIEGEGSLEDAVAEGMFGDVNEDDEYDAVLGSVLPDLSDPATLGCLLALVREAWSDDRVSCFYSSTICAWVVKVPSGDIYEDYASEGGALVAALEAAGRR